MRRDAETNEGEEKRDEEEGKGDERREESLMSGRWVWACVTTRARRRCKYATAVEG